MSANTPSFLTAWDKLDPAVVQATLPAEVSLDTLPALPITRAADMPPAAGFARGSLGIELRDLRLDLSGSTATPRRNQDREGRDVLELHVSGIRLCGRQIVQGTQIWETGLDGAGTGLPLNVKRRGGSDQNAHPTWIATANQQRGELQNVPGGNGATLLSTYSNHRAAFNDAFTDPLGYAFQTGWGVPAISDMAADTNTALTQGGTVNDPTKVYGTTTYNGNAQTQQLALMTTLTAMAAAKDPQQPKNPNNPYNQAAAATLTFSSSVITNTNSSNITNVGPQTKASVYQTVQDGTPAAPHSVDDVHAFLSGNPIGGRDADGNTWTMCLAEDERAFVRQVQADIAEHAARLAAQKPVDLSGGGVTADFSCYVYLLLEVGEDGTTRLRDGRVELDGFDLDIDDSAWDRELGPALAAETRTSLMEARFIKSLLHDRIADALERALVQPIARMVLDRPS
jgi:hypothetical protein